MNQDTALMRGVRTGIQAIIGLVTGLVAVVWAVPGVPQAVVSYMQSNWFALALAVGIPSGVASFIWNALRSDVKNI